MGTQTEFLLPSGYLPIKRWWFSMAMLVITRWNHFGCYRSRKRRNWLLRSSRWLSARPHNIPHPQFSRSNSEVQHLWNTKKREVQLLVFFVSQRSLSMFQLLTYMYVKPAFEFARYPVVHNPAISCTWVFQKPWTPFDPFALTCQTVDISGPPSGSASEDELVFEQGERGTQFFLLVEGEVSVSWCEGSALRSRKRSLWKQRMFFFKGCSESSGYWGYSGCSPSVNMCKQCVNNV